MDNFVPADLFSIHISLCVGTRYGRLGPQQIEIIPEVHSHPDHCCTARTAYDTQSRRQQLHPVLAEKEDIRE